MNLYAIRRRRLCRPEAVEEIDARSNAERAKRPDRISKVRSYLLEEDGGWLGSICMYQADGPETIVEHARAAGLPCDEITLVGAIDALAPDPELAGGPS